MALSIFFFRSREGGETVQACPRPEPGCRAGRSSSRWRGRSCAGGKLRSRSFTCSTCSISSIEIDVAQRLGDGLALAFLHKLLELLFHRGALLLVGPDDLLIARLDTLLLLAKELLRILQIGGLSGILRLF